MTMMEVLSEIRDQQGRDALLDGKRLPGLFEDYSKGKLRPEYNALRVLVECGGNERIAQLRNAPPDRQKTELHRLMRELVTKRSMQETMAREICGAVWVAFCGSAFPLTSDHAAEPLPRREESPRKKQPEPMLQPQSQPKPEEAKEKPKAIGQPMSSKPESKFILQLKQTNKFVLYVLAAGVLGAVGLIAAGAWWILTASGSDWKLALIILALGVLTIRRVVKVWQGKTDDKTIPRWMEFLVFITICIIGLLLVGGAVVSLGAMEINSGFIGISLLCLALSFLCVRLLDKFDKVTSWCQESGTKLAMLSYVVGVGIMLVIVFTGGIDTFTIEQGLFCLAFLLNSVFNIYWHGCRL